MKPHREELTAGRAEVRIVWKYNEKLEMSTRRSIKNSLENTRGGAEWRMKSQAEQSRGWEEGVAARPTKNGNPKLGYEASVSSTAQSSCFRGFAVCILIFQRSFSQWPGVYQQVMAGHSHAGNVATAILFRALLSDIQILIWWLGESTWLATSEFGPVSSSWTHTGTFWNE